jgi:hypothetical protein
MIILVIEGALLPGKPVMSLVSEDYYATSLPSLLVILLSVLKIKYFPTLSSRGF